MLSECRNHIPFVLSEVRVSHVFYFLAGANFMIIASHCFYVQRCRTSYLNPRLITKHLRRIPNVRHFWFTSVSVFTAQCFEFSGLRCSPLNAALGFFEPPR
ncbi:hypothetical protein CMV05_18960 [Vibrio anguillarum]|nr:hypothetical protein CMV05_18960 [Vibrio anguillarum]